MKISNVEAVVLESPYQNCPPEGSDEAHGVKHCLLLKVSTDEGLVGWSDVETAPHVAAAVVSAPESGSGVFEGLRSLVMGEDPFEVERLWDKIYRGTMSATIRCCAKSSAIPCGWTRMGSCPCRRDRGLGSTWMKAR